GDVVGARQLAVEELPAQGDEEGGVRAAGDGAGFLAVAAVGGAERFQKGRDTLLPVGGRIPQHVGAAAEVDEQDVGKQREEVHDLHGAYQAGAEEAGGALADFRRERVEDGEAAQGEAGVVKIGAALASGEAAVGVLSPAEVGGVASAEILREALQTVR